ncbi:MAG: LLM class flavin-dependent oxidoreductase [Candidatus Heimdallarchaeota archaeon]|nr:LLM class flavin-dependent oxidoreductase [Candidatus Heimdallarchaeota archaeon]
MNNQPELEVSIAFQTDKEILEYGRIAKKVEEFGFDRITVYNDMLYQPAWLPLTIIAQTTDKIKLGPAAVNPFTSHPMNIAGNISLLNDLSKGRAYLGLARGAWLDFIGVSHPKPITALREAFICINHLLNRDKRELEGEFFPLSGGDTLRWNTTEAKIPMLLGTWGLKTLDRCFPYVSEVKIGGTVNSDYVSYFKKRIDEIKIKRSFQNSVAIVAGAVCVVDEEGEVARELAKKEVSLYLPVVAELDKTVNLEKSILEGITEATKRYDFDAASEFISDSLLEKFAFAGTVEDVIQQSIRLFDGGASRIEYGTPHGLEMNRGVELLGKEVLPVIKEYIQGI